VFSGVFNAVTCKDKVKQSVQFSRIWTLPQEPDDFTVPKYFTLGLHMLQIPILMKLLLYQLELSLGAKQRHGPASPQFQMSQISLGHILYWIILQHKKCKSTYVEEQTCITNKQEKTIMEDMN
jgi:hypothetical protein